MEYDPERYHRHLIRLRDYDYSRPGAYYVTMCTRERECLFGDIVDGEMRLNESGKAVRKEWLRSAEIRDEIDLDQFVVLPNHLHGIVMITPVGATGRSPLPMAHDDQPRGPAKRSLGSFIAGFKSAATRRINEMRGAPGVPLWQRNYYEHIIRDDGELEHIRQYIEENPARWAEDRENPANR